MRIEAGQLRGRVLQAPAGDKTRPTDGRTREMLFNSLGQRIVGARVLDLYAGSGSVGLEALSRGAEFCVFVEQEHAALRALRNNLKIFGLSDKAQVWAANARVAPQRLDESGEKFDFIFADPPFSLPNEAEEIAKRLDAWPKLLNNEGADAKIGSESVMVIQHSRRVTLPVLVNFALAREKRAGESTLSFFVPHFPEAHASESQ